MPRWGRDGGELFYLASNQFITALPVKNKASLELGPAVQLFRTRLVVQGSEATGLPTTYDVAPDGQRFLLRYPPTNPELLAALAKDFIDHNFDMRHIIRELALSNAYALSSVPTDGNKSDVQNFARFYSRRLIAEVLHDAVDQATGTKSSFNGVAASARAIDRPPPMRRSCQRTGLSRQSGHRSRAGPPSPGSASWAATVVATRYSPRRSGCSAPR